MAVISFTADHLRAMRVKAGTAAEVAGSPGFAERMAALGAKTILSAEGTVLGIMGAVPILPHVAEVFVIASEDQTSHPVTFAKSVRKELYTLKAKYRRIQSVSVTDEFHRRWLSWLGFEPEGVMKGYGLDGEDMTIWGLV